MTKTEYEILKLQQEKAELNRKIAILELRREETERKLAMSTRQSVANEVSQFLLDVGFEDASKAVDCEYEL